MTGTLGKIMHAIPHSNKIHPLTRIFMSLLYLIVVFRLPIRHQVMAIITGMIMAWGAKKLPSQDPGKIFLRLWFTAGLFLLIIHCIIYNNGLVFDNHGFVTASKSFFRIGSLMIVFLWLSRTIKSEELYAMLMDIGLSMSLIYLLLRTIYTIPRLGSKANEILVAQQARGFVLKGIGNRIKGLQLILAPLFSSMVYELEESSASLTARGIIAPGRKSHFVELKFGPQDVLLIVSSMALTTLLLVRI